MCHAYDFDMDDVTGTSIINKHKQLPKYHLRKHHFDMNQYYDEVQLRLEDESNNFHYFYTNLDIISKVDEHKISGKRLRIVAEFISIREASNIIYE